MHRFLALLPVALLLATSAPANADASSDAAARAVAWLASHRFEAKDEYYAEAAAATGEEPHRWPATGATLVANLSREDFAGYDLLAWERWTETVAATGEDPSRFAGEDGVQKIREAFDGEQFGSVTLLNDDAWAILALVGAGVAPQDREIQSAATFLKANRDHVPLLGAGWGYGVPGKSDTDVTGAVLAALAAAGVPASDPDVSAAADWLAATEDTASGGWSSFDGIPVNPDSTAWALLGFKAAGRAEPEAGLAYLRALQCDDGAIRYEASAKCDDSRNGIATTDAVLALAGGRMPILRYAPLKLSLPSPAHALDALTFEARGMSVARAAWSFGDGESGAGASPLHVYGAKGSYEVAVGVWSGDGRKGWANATLAVATARPVASLDVAAHGANASADGSASFDPDGAVARWRFDWGDGNVTTGAASLTTHAYAASGNYTVSLAVTDDEGATSDTVARALRVDLPRPPPRVENASEANATPASPPAALPSATNDSKATDAAASNESAKADVHTSTDASAPPSENASGTPSTNDTANDASTASASSTSPRNATTESADPSSARPRTAPPPAPTRAALGGRELASDELSTPVSEPIARSTNTSTPRDAPSFGRTTPATPVATILLCAALAAWGTSRPRRRRG